MKIKSQKKKCIAQYMRRSEQYEDQSLEEKVHCTVYQKK